MTAEQLREQTQPWRQAAQHEVAERKTRDHLIHQAATQRDPLTHRAIAEAVGRAGDPCTWCNGSGRLEDIGQQGTSCTRCHATGLEAGTERQLLTHAAIHHILKRDNPREPTK